jgi:multidrug efflux system membrane fusion protein
MIEHKVDETHPKNHSSPVHDGNGQRALPQAPEVKALPAPAPRRHPIRSWLMLLVLCILGYAGYRYYENGEEKRAAAEAAQSARAAHRPVPVAVTTVRRGDLPVYLRGLGTVTAYNTVNVKTRVDGPLTAVNFKEGQMVKQGELLAVVDPRPYQVALQQAEGNLARDQALDNDAKVNLARYQKLWEEGVIARQQLDTQAAQVGQYGGAIAVDQASIANAKLNLSFTTIQAPIAGRIGLRMVDIGNIVHASDANPMAVITQMQPIAVIFTLPADSLPPVAAKLRAGANLPVYAYDRGDVNKIAEGTLETVDNQIDVSTGTARLKAIFQNQDAALFPNQFVNCRLLLETHHGVVLVPAAAIQQGPQGPYAYIIKPDDTAHMTPVTLGITEGTEVEVSSGLAAGDTVVTDGQDKLQEGSPVQATSAPRNQPFSPPNRPGRGGRKQQ